MKWEKVEIRSVCEGIYDGPHATPPMSDNGAIFLGISNITADGHLDFSDIKYINEQDLPKWTKRVTPREGDIVFSYEATLNLYAMIPANFWGCLGRRMALIRPNPKKINGKYLYYYFFSEQWRSVIAENIVTGATVDRIPLIRFPQFPIYLPSLEIQNKIASILSAYDDLIENNKKQIKLLEEAAQRLYKEWFVDLRFPGHENVPVVDGVPDGWEKCTITDLLNIGYGKDHKKLSDGDIPAYGSGGIFRKVNQKLHSGEAVLIPRKGTLNNIIHVDSDFWTIDTMFFGVPKIENCAKYAYFYLRYQDMYSYNIGAAVPSMTVNILDGMELLLPTKLMLENFERTIEPLFSKQKLLTKQNETLTLSRDFLLPKLMSGEIEV